MLVIAIIDENVTADLIPDDFKQQAVVGSPDQVAEQIKTKVLDAGVDGVILSPVTSLNGYHPGGITAVGEALKPLVARINPAATWDITQRTRRFRRFGRLPWMV